MTNQVVLQGRLSREPEVRELPSGDAVWTLRIVMRREGSERPGVDWIDCSVWAGRLLRSVETWRVDDIVELEGSLRRRFFRVAGQPVSRVEVEARAGRLIRRSGPA